MPFRSKAQMKACFATDGFGGKVDCKEWARVTNIKSLPSKKEEGGTNMYRPKKMQRAGLMWEQQQRDQMAMEPNLQVPLPFELPVIPPSNTQEAFEERFKNFSPETHIEAIKKKQQPKNPMTAQEIGLLMQSLRTGVGFFAGIKERSRQNQYDWMQQTALGQMNPMPVDDFQPNPFSLYAKYGGNLKSIMRDYNKWTNDAHMDFGSGDEDRGKAQRGGKPVTRPKLNTELSLVDYMKSININPSFDTRHYLFDELFKEEYKGTAKQNEEVLRRIKQKKIEPTDLNMALYEMHMLKNAPPDNEQMKKGGFELDRTIITRKIIPELLKLGRLGTSKYRGR